MQRTSDANTESIVKIITKDIRPKQLSTEEVKAKVREIIAQVGATSIKDMGSKA